MEFYERITDAIQCESNLKHWPRAQKTQLAEHAAASLHYAVP